MKFCFNYKILTEITTFTYGILIFQEIKLIMSNDVENRQINILTFMIRNFEERLQYLHPKYISANT